MKRQSRSSAPFITLLLQLIDLAYNKKSWHGTNLRGSIRGLTARQATWRPASSRHNIAEIVLHCAYWKYIVRRRILGEKKGSFPVKGSNWFHCPAKLTEKEWRQDVELLESCHAALRKTIAQLSLADLSVVPAGSKFDNAFVLTGIASHDLYHAGQIQLLKRLSK